MVLHRLSGLAFALALLTSLAVSAQRPPARHARPTIAVKHTASVAVAYKGIFEPRNYPDDLNLLSVFFVNENEGWMSAEHGILVHTIDGGNTWKAQLGGDINSTEEPIYSLRFLDRSHGWAVQGNARLLHTRDGQHWLQTGSLPGSPDDWTFTSERTGIFVDWRGVQLSRDGGRTWRSVATCSAKLQVQGLVQTVGCQPKRILFVSQRVGYVAGMSGGDLGALFILKTLDGGYTWRVSVIPSVSPWGGVESLFFLDEKTGFVRLNDGKLWTTRDGGQHWQGIAGTTTPGHLMFADPEVGWSFNSNGQFSYTIDGGQSWSARNLQFPARIAQYSLPRRDIAYVVGEHGMVYRYHVVPQEYEVANAVQAPPMPGFNVAINAQIARIRTDIVALKAKLNPKLVAAGLPPVTATPSDGSTTADAGTVAAQQADTSTAPGTDTPTSGVNSYETSAGNSADATNSVDGTAPQLPSGDTPNMASSDNVSTASASPAPTDSAAAASDSASADFSQPASPAVESCCAAEVNHLQTDVSAFQQQVPAFATKYRTLNLILAGMRMAQDMIGKADAFKTTLIAFKKAPNLQSAASVLQDFIGKYEGARQEFATGFANPPPLGEADATTTAAAAAPTTAAIAADASTTPVASEGVA